MMAFHLSIPRSLFVLLATLLFLAQSEAKAPAPAPVIEPRTGISFQPKVLRAPLKKIGLRLKGPIKVYAVGQYGKNIFVLKMVYSVNPEKLSGALMDALKPRCEKLGCEKGEASKFKQFVLDALPKTGAKKGTELIFNTGGGKVMLTVNGLPKGKMVGKPLAQAFAGIYTDTKAVCKMIAVDDDGDEYDFRSDPDMVRALGIMSITTLGILLWGTNKTRKAPPPEEEENSQNEWEGIDHNEETKEQIK
jgi:hypothetical protein